MNHKIINKILATMLVITLTFANIILLGVYASETYAADENLEKQTTATNNENVEFDAYFKQGSNSVHSLKEDINTDSTLMYLYIKVKKGYLKNASVSMYGESASETSNFVLKNSEAKYELIQNIDSTSNKITLNQIDEGTEAVLEVPITMNSSEKIDTNNFGKTNNIKISGTYVNEKGKEIAVEKNIRLRLELTAKAEIVVEQEVQRYLQIDENKVLLQSKISSGILNNTLPVETTTLEIVAPKIKGVKPSKVDVIAYNTYATNGQEGEKFNKDNWTYDEETEKITITVKNEKENNIVSWKKDCKDEYVVTYIYEDNALNDITSKPIETNEEITAVVKAYNNVATEVTNKINSKIELNKEIGQIVTSEAIVNITEMGKGLLYTKANTADYIATTLIDIGYAEGLDKIVVDNLEDKFIVGDKTKETQNSVIYKTTKISKENFNKILGEEGKLIIKTSNNEEIGSIDKDSSVDENGNYVFVYENKISTLKFETSKPIAQGKLKIENQKQVTGNTKYTKAEISKFTALKVEGIVVAYKENIELAKNELAKQINLVEPKTKFEVEINKQNLSTVVKNENVQIRVILKTNGIDCDLYKNPTIEIELPSYIEALDIKDVNLLFDEELEIEKYNTYKNNDGKIVISLQVKGEDTKYNIDNITKGANIVINADITIKELTPTTEDIAKIYVTNQNVTTYEITEETRAKTAPKGYAGVNLKAVAPVGLITTNEIKGETTSVKSNSLQDKALKIEIKSKAQTAELTTKIANNNEASIKNVSILGRLPFEGNKTITSKEDLNSNLTTTLVEKVTITNVPQEKVTIYYSENGEATKDLNVATNGWTKEPKDLSKVKTYLIVLNDYEMPIGTSFELKYKVNIPADLNHNRYANVTNAMYYALTSEPDVEKVKEISTAFLTTGAGAELEAGITSNIEGESTEEGKKVTYKIAVKNVGKEEVTNVNIKGTIKQDNYKESEFEGTIESIKPNETKIFEKDYYVRTLPKGLKEGEITVTAGISTKTLEKEISATYKNKVSVGYFNISLSGEKETLEKSKIQYNLNIRNLNAENRQNVAVTIKIPDGLAYKDATDYSETLDHIKYDEKSKTLTWNIGEIKGQSSQKLYINVTANEIEKDKTKEQMEVFAKVKWDGKEFSSNKVQTSVLSKHFEVTYSNNKTEGVLLDNEEIEYYITVKNTGEAYIPEIKLTAILPSELNYKLTRYTVNEKTTESRAGTSTKVNKTISLGVGETALITIVADTHKLKEEQKDIETKLQVTMDDKLISEKVMKHTMQYVKPSEILPDGTVTEKTYSISGFAWLDSVADGKKDENELMLGGIDVMLINAENGEIVKNSAGENIIVKTDENGKYTFEGLKKGKYRVVFLYDAAEYDVTTYKAQGITESENSDAISMKFSLNGTIQKGAISDTLALETSNIYNINLGLIVSPKFDLSLNKAVSKITVTSSKETKTKDYKDTKLAKVDVNPKYINSTNVIVEYKITVTNEGAVAGYAKKIVDYIPEDMKFSSELNTNWYKGKDGNLYSTELSNVLLNPGESKDIKLVLTRKMTENNTGIVNNKAEIVESYNELGMADIDSVAGNKSQQEDDFSMADVIISPRTGEVIMYTILTITIITMLGVGIYLINKKVLK